MGNASIAWDVSAARVAADPAATIALDRAAWERAGATFDEVDDRDGETPGLATATVLIGADHKRLAVLDYGADSTYLLIPGSGIERRSATKAVLDALEDAGILTVREHLLDLTGMNTPAEGDREDLRSPDTVHAGRQGTGRSRHGMRLQIGIAHV